MRSMKQGQSVVDTSFVWTIDIYKVQFRFAASVDEVKVDFLEETTGYHEFRSVFLIESDTMTYIHRFKLYSSEYFFVVVKDTSSFV